MELWLFLVLCTLPFIGFKGALLLALLFSDGTGMVRWATLAFLSSMVVGSVLYLLTDMWLQLGRLVFGKHFAHWEKRIQQRANHAVRKYSIVSLSIFLMVPWPNSGNYASAVFARVLGYRTADYMKGLLVGSALYCSALTGVFLIVFAVV